MPKKRGSTRQLTKRRPIKGGPVAAPNRAVASLARILGRIAKPTTKVPRSATGTSRGAKISQAAASPVAAYKPLRPKNTRKRTFR